MEVRGGSGVYPSMHWAACIPAGPDNHHRTRIKLMYLELCSCWGFLVHPSQSMFAFCQKEPSEFCRLVHLSNISRFLAAGNDTSLLLIQLNDTDSIKHLYTSPAFWEEWSTSLWSLFSVSVPSDRLVWTAALVIWVKRAYYRLVLVRRGQVQSRELENIISDGNRFGWFNQSLLLITQMDRSCQETITIP